MRRLIYPTSLLLLLAIWATTVQVTGSWQLLQEHWVMAATMVLGSFVAGSTPAGGGSVAFPAFTKILQIPSSDAALFGLMIQSVGMSMAALFIISRRIPYYRNAYLWAAAGGCVGVVPAVLFLRIPAPFPKLLFSCLILSFGLVLYWLQKNKEHPIGHEIHQWTRPQRVNLFTTGIAGGILTSQLGSGADMIVFIVMIVAFDLSPKRAIPTTVLTMATISMAGFLSKLILQPQEIGVVWHYWGACVPVVAIGAPLGAFVLSKLSQSTVVYWVLALIAVEVTSTLFVIEFTLDRIGFIILVLTIAAGWIKFLVSCRNAGQTRPSALFAIDN